MSTGKIITSVFAGIAAGAILGILFAPDKGSRTRKKIMMQGNDFKDMLQDKFNEFADDLSEQYEKMKDHAKSEYEKFKSNGKEYPKRSVAS